MAVSTMSRQHSGPLNKKFIQIGHRSTASRRTLFLLIAKTNLFGLPSSVALLHVSLYSQLFAQKSQKRIFRIKKFENNNG